MLQLMTLVATVALSSGEDRSLSEGSDTDQGDAPSDGSDGSSEPPPAPAPEPAPAPAPAPADGQRAGTVRAQPGSRSSFGSLRFGGAWGRDIGVSGDGLALLVGGTYGAYVGTATALAAFGEDSPGVAIPGGLVGATVGGLGGYALARRQEASTDQVLLVGSSAGYGTFLGYQVTRLAIGPDATEDGRRVQAGGVLGSMIGAGVGLLVAPNSPDQDRTIQADIGLGAGWLAGTGINDLMGLDVHEDRAARVPITTLTATAAGALGLGADAWGWHRPSPAVSMLALGQGTWIGFWAPALANTDDFGKRAWAGARIGLGAGQVLSYGLAGLKDPDENSVVYQIGGAAFGNALGAGLPLLARGEDVETPGVVGPMLAGSLAGQVTGALLAPPEGSVRGDNTLLPLGLSAWTVWQSAGWGAYVGERRDDSARGFGTALTLFGAGGFASLGLAGRANLAPQATTLMLSSGAWGSGLGALTGLAAGLDGEQNLALSLGVGDVALLGTGLAVAAGGEPSWGTVARVNTGMAVGGSLGALGAVIFAYDSGRPGTAAAATVIGSGLGLGAALLIPGPDRHREQSALVLPGLHLPRLPIQASWSVAPWRGEDGSQGAFLSVQGHDRVR